MTKIAAYSLLSVEAEAEGTQCKSFLDAKDDLVLASDLVTTCKKVLLTHPKRQKLWSQHFVVPVHPLGRRDRLLCCVV